jgi:WD40 repeat protein
MVMAYLDFRAIGNHSRSEDHSDVITTICPIKKLGIFVTASKDCSIRVWDNYNNLLRYFKYKIKLDQLIISVIYCREVQFHEPLDSLCITGSNGNALIGIQNRIDIIKYSSYLPPGYVNTVESMELSEKYPERPIKVCYLIIN